MITLCIPKLLIKNYYKKIVVIIIIIKIYCYKKMIIMKKLLLLQFFSQTYDNGKHNNIGIKTNCGEYRC